jgi:hypothetical protein
VASNTPKKSVQQKPVFAWQDTKGGLVFIVLFDLIGAYTFVSLAINSGSLLQYFVAIVFLVLAIGQFVKLIKKVLHHG